MASSLDQIGPITKTVEDAAILFKAIAGRDQVDATNAGIEYGDELTEPGLESIKQLTVGLPEEYFIEGLDGEVRRGVELAIEKIKSLGLKFKKISLPHTKYALSCYYIIVPAEVSANLARFDGIRYSRTSNLKPKTLNLKEIYLKQRGEGFGAESKRRIILGTFVLSSGYYDAYYEKAQRVRALIRQDFKNAFKEVDVILAPVTPTPAFKIGEKISDPLSMYLSDVFTVPINLAGLPSVSIPVKKYHYPNQTMDSTLQSNSGQASSPRKELPVGFQLIGKHFREGDILGLGRYYEKLN